MLSLRRRVLTAAAAGALLPAVVPAGGAPAAAGTWPDLLNLGFQVINVHSRQCLAADGADAPVQQTCDRGAAQRWRFRPGSPAGTFEVVHHRTGRCLTGRGTAAVLAGCDGRDAVRWQLRDSAGSTARLRNAATGRCLTVAGGAVTDGAPAVQDTCDDRRSRRWTVRLLALTPA